MAKDGTFHITFKVDADGKNFKLLSGDVNGLKKVMTSTVVESEKLKTSFINFAAVTASVRNAQAAISGLQSSLQDLAGSYYASEEQKTKMVTVMRQRMTATDQEVASVNKLIAAQTELGVLGGTTQRAGAQQLATFLSTSKSLQTLIPAMNDLVAQQKGLKAGTEDAVGVANLMGKAMTGQTSALRRVGIVFTDAQAEVLKYGNEQERAATLAQVITDNVGHMNQALAETNAGRIKQMSNSFGALKARIGEVASKALPTLTFATSSLNMVMNVLQVNLAGSSLIKWAKGLSVATIATKAHTAATKSLNSLSIIWNTTAKFVTGTNAALGTSGYAAAGGLTAVKMALRGLLIATGVGAVIAALTFGIEALMNALSEGGNQAEKVSDGLTNVQRVTKETTQTFEQTSAQTYSSLKTRYAELQAAWKSLKSEHQKNAWIKENQSAFKDLGVSVGSAKDAEDVFVKNTAKVEAAFKKRAEAAANAAVLTELYERKLQLELAIDRRNNDATNRHRTFNQPNKKAGDSLFGVDSFITNQLGGLDTTTDKRTGVKVLTDIGAKRYNEIARNTKWVSRSTAQRSDQGLLAAVKSQISDVSKKVAASSRESTVYTPTSYGTSGKQGRAQREKADKKLSEIQNPVSENDYANNLRYYEEQRAKVNMTSDAYKKWTDKIKETQKAFDKLKGTSNEKTMIVNPKSVKDYENNLSVLRDKQKEVTSPEDYKDLQHQIDEVTKSLAKLKGEEIYTPGAASELDTIEKLDKAISYYQELQTKQTANEIQNTQRTINALEDKKKAMQTGMEIPSMQKEIAEINSLSGKEFKIKVSALGFDTLTDKIEKLQKQLNDTKNPVTGEQRQDIEGMIATYEQWRKVSVKSFDTVKEGWGSVKGIGDSISSVTQALESNGNAWQKITTIMDSFIQLYESMSAIIKIIDMLTNATKGHTVAKQTETAATNTDTAATLGNVAAKGAETTASIVNTSAKSGEAIADATSSGAKLPFPLNLAAIAAGVAAVLGALSMIGSFSTGGIVGGSSPSGDKLLARVNSGEMILNRRQQQRLLDILSGKSLGLAVSQKLVTPAVSTNININPDRLRTLSQPNDTGMGGKVRFEISARNLVGVLANDTRISSKSGRRTNIKI